MKISRIVFLLAAVALAVTASVLALTQRGGGAEQPDAGSACEHPDWVAGTWYPAGSVVKYTDGRYYVAEQENQGYDPTISTWYWNPYPCDGRGVPSAFPVTESQFNEIFPNRNPFYSYAGLVEALSAYPGFANTGDEARRKREAAAFLANVDHETAGLRHIVEQNQAQYSRYCDHARPYGCPAGQAAYYGRGALQLSWNFNYKAAGDALGTDLLDNPQRVEQDATLAWKTALWYWNTKTGDAKTTPHDAMVAGVGFGETVRGVNGALECGGRSPANVQSRVDAYRRISRVLEVDPGGNLYC
ncbi:MAG TPA: glycoside hydrolase family 19 protein [Kribbella sp.]|nr:glycoside hydrolase family 19 protein [Kribbella sp.]